MKKPPFFYLAGMLLIAGFLVLKPGGPPARPSAETNRGEHRPEPVFSSIALQPVTGTLSVGQAVAFPLDLEAGSVAKIRVEQMGLDVSLGLKSSEGLVCVDTNETIIRAYGEEMLWYHSKQKGRFYIQLHCGQRMGPKPHYLLNVEIDTKPSKPLLKHVSAFSHYAESMAEAEAGKMQKVAMAEAVALFSHSGDKRLEGLARYASACILQAAEPEKALAQMERAAQLFEENGSSIHAVALLAELGYLHQMRGHPQKAMEFYDHCHRLAPSANRFWEGVSLNNWGGYYQRQGHLQKALDYYRRALEFYERYGFRKEMPQTYINLAGTLMLARRTEEARDALLRGESILREQPALAVMRQKGDLLIQRAWSHFQDGDYPLAVELLNQVLHLKNQPELMVWALARLGTVYRIWGKLEQAQRIYERALKLAHRPGHPQDLAGARINLAQVLLERGDLNRAGDIVPPALDFYYESGDLEGQVNAYKLSAQIHWGLEREAQASAFFEKMLTTLESLRGDVSNPLIARSVTHVRQSYYEAYLSFLADVAETRTDLLLAQKALWVSEQNRARALREVYSSRRVGGREDEATRHELADLRSRVNQTANRLKEPPESRKNGATEAELQRDIRDALARLNEKRGLVARQHASKPPGQPSLDQVRSTLLDEETAVLVYALTPTQSHVWVITRETFFAVSDLAPDDQIAWRARKLARSWGSGPMASQQPRENHLARSLSQLILEPVWPYLQDKKRILLVADGSLNLLPFSALPRPFSQDPTATPTLLTTEWVRLPSLTLGMMLAKQNHSAHRAEKAMAVFGDPVYSHTDPRLKSRATVENAARLPGWIPLPRLIYSASLCRQMKTWFAPETFYMAVGFAANRDNFVRLNLEDYQMLHFSSHSLLHEAQPELSAIVLSTLDPEGHPRDGSLRVFDLFDAYLPHNQLAVISGCRTARGELLNGEGIFGLSEALMAAGCPRIVSSLWQVDNRSTEQLMSYFYHALLREKKPPAQALKEAKQKIRDTPGWQNPFYWAGFVFSGNWRGFETIY